MDEMAAMAAQFADAALPFSDPEGAAARATAEPMAMYIERAARCPVERLERRLRGAAADGRHPLREQAPRRRTGVEVPRQQPAGDPPRSRRRRAPEVPPAARPRLHGQARRTTRRQRARARRRDDRHVRRRRRGPGVRALVRTVAVDDLPLDSRAAARRPRRLPALQEPHPRERVRHAAVRRGDGAARGSGRVDPRLLQSVARRSARRRPIPATTCSAGSSRPRWRASDSPARTSSTSSGC